MPDITSRKNPEIQHLRRLLEDGALRREEQTYICHGKTALCEAISCGTEIKKVYAIRREDIPGQTQGVTVSAEVLSAISGVENTGDPVFTARMKPETGLSGKKYIALEDVRDPGNVGTIIRTADAFGLDGVVFLGNCADPYAPKTVRSAMGSNFRVPFIFTDLDALAESCIRLKIKLYAAALSSDAQSLSHTGLEDCCVMIGNEARGLSDKALKLAEKRIIIPIKNAESLNAAVAAAVFMWEMSRN